MGVILYINPLLPTEDKIARAILRSNHQLSCTRSLDVAIQIIQNFPLEAVIAHDFNGDWKLLIELVGLDIPLILYSDRKDLGEEGFIRWGSDTSGNEILNSLNSINNSVKPSELKIL